MPSRTSLGVLILGADESWDKATPQDLVAHGYKWVASYLSPDVNGKNWTRDLIRASHGAGLAVLPVWEYAADAAKHGGLQGQQDAANACTLLKSLGWPTGRTVYFAIDFDVQQADLAAVRAYMVGAVTVCERNGYHADAYGDFVVIDDLRRAGLITFGWQTYAWSHGQWAPGVILRQFRNGVTVAGHTIDNDMAYSVEFGQWSPPNWDPGPGIGGIMQPEQAQQLGDTAWAVTQDADIDDPTKRVPLQVWTGQVNARLNAMATLINEMSTTVATVGKTMIALVQADKTLADAVVSALARMGDQGAAEQTLMSAWTRIADAAERLSPPPAPAAPPPAPGLGAQLRDTLP